MFFILTSTNMCYLYLKGEKQIFNVQTIMKININDKWKFMLIHA